MQDDFSSWIWKKLKEKEYKTGLKDEGEVCVEMEGTLGNRATPDPSPTLS